MERQHLLTLLAYQARTGGHFSADGWYHSSVTRMLVNLDGQPPILDQNEESSRLILRSLGREKEAEYFIQNYTSQLVKF